MPDPNDAVENQKRNIEASTGRAFDAWVDLARASGLEKHGELIAWLKSEHGMSHGNANLIALSARRGADAPTGDALVDADLHRDEAAAAPAS